MILSGTKRNEAKSPSFDLFCELPTHIIILYTFTLSYDFISLFLYNLRPDVL